MAREGGFVYSKQGKKSLSVSRDGSAGDAGN